MSNSPRLIHCVVFESKYEIFLDMKCCHNFDKRPVVHNSSTYGNLSILSRPYSLKLNVWCLEVKCCYRHNVMINVMSAPVWGGGCGITSLTFLKTTREELQLFSSKNRENHLDSAEQQSRRETFPQTWFVYWGQVSTTQCSPLSLVRGIAGVSSFMP